MPELDFVWALLKATPEGETQSLMDSLLAFPTPAALITANVTPVMEQQLVFLMTQVYTLVCLCVCVCVCLCKGVCV